MNNIIALLKAVALLCIVIPFALCGCGILGGLCNSHPETSTDANSAPYGSDYGFTYPH